VITFTNLQRLCHTRSAVEATNVGTHGIVTRLLAIEKAGDAASSLDAKPGDSGAGRILLRPACPCLLLRVDARWDRDAAPLATRVSSIWLCAHTLLNYEQMVMERLLARPEG
jgi:hypothetical protein